MKFDDATWHSGGNYPAGLAPDAGATHAGMFVCWALLAGLGGALHVDEFPEHLAILKSRRVTPGVFVLSACAGKFTDEDLSEEGNLFACAYYLTNQYYGDYERVVGRGVETLYHVPDTWETFERLAPILDERFEQWRRDRASEAAAGPAPSEGGDVTAPASPRPTALPRKPWWKFW
jgi:hypothetical protein